MKFSQRIGEVETEKVAQLGSIDQELTNGLWSAVVQARLTSFPPDSMSGKNDFEVLWELFFKLPLDEVPEYESRALGFVKRRYFEEFEWYQKYDFIEFIAHTLLRGNRNRRNKFINHCTYHLDRENSAYRFIDGKLTEITSPDEIQEVESALTDTQGFAGVKTHLSRALTLMNNRESPDYRNSIKESISAVECLVKIIVGQENATLGKALSILEGETSLHPALRDGFQKLYGYSSDAKGIRHSLTVDDRQPSKAEARFMLITCSAFVNYSKSIIPGSHI